MDQLPISCVVVLLASVGAALAQSKLIAGDKGFSPRRMSGAKRWRVSCHRLSSVVILLSFFLVTLAKADDSIPGPTRTIIVSSSWQLASALNNAQPGDHIVLTNGSYSGFTVSRSGQIDKPVVVRAANTLAARVSGRITLSGDDVYVVGVDVSNGNVVIEGTRDRISRSRLRSPGIAVDLDTHARSAIVDHNEIDSQATATTRGWYGIMVGVASSGLNHRIYRNYFHGAPRGDENAAIRLGGGQRRLTSGGVLVEYNLFMDWHGSAETISVKTSGHTIRFNTGIDIQQFVNRGGAGSTWSANWLENSRGIRIHDKNHTLLGNRSPIDIFGGDREGPAGTGIYYQPIDTLVAGNTGTLLIGKSFANGRAGALPARDTKVEAHNGWISRLNEVNTNIASRTTRIIPRAFKLMPSDVGPFAPTAPSISG